MTTNQRKMLYWPAWSRVTRAQSWRMLGGRLAAAEPVGPANTLPDQLLRHVWTAAAQRALALHRAVTPDDLRHACHITACDGRDISSLKLTNTQINRVICLWNILANPDDLAALSRWLHPENDQRDALIWSIKKAAAEDYIRSVVVDIHDTANWQDLETSQLQRLLAKLRGRNHSGRTNLHRRPAPAPVHQHHDDPY